jgi:SnoaL-like domain
VRIDEPGVPDLEKMNEQQARDFLTEMFTHLSAEAEYEMRHEDYVMEMPQSGERIRGRGKMKQFQEAFASYSNPPTIHLLRRMVVREGLWILEGVNDYGEGQVFTVMAIFELRDGKVWRDTRYYAEPFEAPEWRAQLVERMES